MPFQNIHHKDIEYTMIIGKNAQDNWDIIKKANPNDIWFHVEYYPSGHVILQNPNKLEIENIPPEVIIECCRKCKSRGSKCRSFNNVSVCYTQIKNVKFGKDIGSVYTSHTSSINV
jgi:predicted ribosome quality control (RQC) complex YloA/Tae2 family protein